MENERTGGMMTIIQKQVMITEKRIRQSGSCQATSFPSRRPAPTAPSSPKQMVVLVKSSSYIGLHGSSA
jgi:hypothetical protein